MPRNGKRHQLDAGEGTAKLHQAARHVVGGGDNDEAAETPDPLPITRFLGIADGIAGAIADVDATVEKQGLRRIRKSLHVPSRYGLVHARDEKAAPDAGIEQGQTIPYPLVATCKYDHRVTIDWRACPVDRHLLLEDDETRQEGDRKRPQQRDRQFEPAAQGKILGGHCRAAGRFDRLTALAQLRGTIDRDLVSDRCRTKMDIMPVIPVNFW